MGTSSQLASKLHTLDGKSYGTLKALTGQWDFESFSLFIDKVQSDPYAPPSRMHLDLPISATEIPAEFLKTAADRVAVADFIARDIADAIKHGPCEFHFVCPGQEILRRSSVTVNPASIQVCFTFGFPAAGRRVKGRAAASLLTEDIRDLVRFSALGERLNLDALTTHVQTYRDFLFIQSALEQRSLVGFVANGAILPRTSGDSEMPFTSATEFVSPSNLEVSFEVPSGRTITGMGISAGITLLVGGGFHGKSTLLRALERGVYAHVPGDGREFVVCDSTAISIRAEDGRAVTGTDISAMIRDLPGGVDTRIFSTTNTSGSTSQAANLAEALEVGAKTLLIDEDTSATNFMIRDERMKALIFAEPITPFVDHVKALWEQLGVSTVLVMGGSGAFLEEAHTVILMENFLPSNVTEKAHRIAGKFMEKTGEPVSVPSYLHHSELAGLGSERYIRSSSLLPDDARKPPRARGLEQIQIGKEDLDVRYLSQLVDPSQTQAIALCLGKVADFIREEGSSLAAAVHAVIAEIEAEGLDKLTGNGSRSRGDLAAPRAAELHQAISRWRKLRVK